MRIVIPGVCGLALGLLWAALPPAAAAASADGTTPPGQPVLSRYPSDAGAYDDSARPAVGRGVPRFFTAKPGGLERAKQQLAAGDKTLAPALKQLLAEANDALRGKPPSVTGKTKVPPSGDRHDYMSLAPYYWPDPAKKDGLPYVRHDGKVNPECRDPKANDNPRLRDMSDAVETLALAYYFTGKEAYAAKAAKYVRVWFFDPATRMNPNFKYAQAVRGVNEGRGTGIIEARRLASAVNALGLLDGSKSWTTADQQALNAWLGTFLDWLLTSKPGQEEANARNNHGTLYDVQTATLALCLERTELARRIVEEAKQRRIAVQIEPDGRQPLELDRTASFGYSRLNLEALTDLATIGEHVGVDLWHFTTADGRGIRVALEFMLPYVGKPAKSWPYEQIKNKREADFAAIFRPAALAYRVPEFEQVVTQYPETLGQRFQLLFPK